MTFHCVGHGIVFDVPIVVMRLCRILVIRKFLLLSSTLTIP